MVGGLLWGASNYIDLFDDYPDKYEILDEYSNNLARWCRGDSIGATAINCEELQNDLDSCVVDVARDLALSAGGLPGTLSGGPAPTDIFAPFIGETINAINR